MVSPSLTHYRYRSLALSHLCDICRNNAKCYLRCGGKMILGSITEGALGSHAGTGVENKAHAYCLWILTVHPDLTVLHSSENVPVITFTMETDIKTECSRVRTWLKNLFTGLCLPLVCWIGLKEHEYVFAFYLKGCRLWMMVLISTLHLWQLKNLLHMKIANMNYSNIFHWCLS